MDKFAWVTEFSVGAFLSPKFDMDKQVPGFMENPKADNRKLKLLFLGVGTEDTRYPGLIKVDKLLTQAGIRHENALHPGRTRMEGLAPPAGGRHAEAVPTGPLRRPARYLRSDNGLRPSDANTIWEDE